MTITAKLDGKIARTGELKQSQSGKAYCNLAISVYYAKDQKTEYVQATFFDELAREASILEKGSAVSVIGNLTLAEYTGKDGLAKQALNVTVSKFISI